MTDVTEAEILMTTAVMEIAAELRNKAAEQSGVSPAKWKTFAAPEEYINEAAAVFMNRVKLVKHAVASLTSR